MARHIRLHGRPMWAVGSSPPILQLVGSLPNYDVGQAYEGRLDILNNIGPCGVEIVWEESFLPPGSAAVVDMDNLQVVVTWPAFTPPEEVKTTIVNGDFQTGTLEGWHDLRGGSWGVEVYDQTPNSGHPANPNPFPPEPGNLAAYMRGFGRGDHILESDRYPVQQGQSIMARSLWDQGPSNKDNNNLFTGLGLYRGGAFVDMVLGDRIHDRTNKRRHWSTVNHTISGGVDEITVRLIAHRRNGRNRPIIVDNVETSGLTYTVGQDLPEEEYCVSLRLWDSAGREAFWYGCLGDDPSAGISAAIRHWWNMDEDSSATYLADKTGNAALEIKSKGDVEFGGPVIRSGGASSIRFTGMGVAESSYFPGWITQTDDYAIAAWVILDGDTAAERRTILGDAPATDAPDSRPLNYRVNVNFTPGGRAEAFWEHGVGVDETAESPGTIPSSQPVLLVVGRDSVNKRVLFHVNGVRVASVEYEVGPEGGDSPDKRLSIGNVQSQDQPLLGFMQDAVVFDRPLSDEEVAWLYNSGSGRSYEEVTAGGTTGEYISVVVPPQSEQMEGFPLYIDLADMPSAFWDGVVRADGGDIRVRTAGGTDLPFHLVRFDPFTKGGGLFARTTLSSTESTVVNVHYGDAINGPVDPDAFNGAYSVWADYHRVFLFNILQTDWTGSGNSASRRNRIKVFDRVAEHTGLTEHQGVCWDGEHYYVTDTNAINKYDEDWNLVATNSDPNGDVGFGVNHCGDPDVHNGIIYIPIEYYAGITNYSSQRIARFRASDLSLIDSVDVSAQGDEVSTVYVDDEEGVVWVGRYSDSTFKINAYDIENLQFVRSLSGTAQARRVQGIHKFKGLWFANSDTDDVTYRITEGASSAVMSWTDIPDGASSRAGNYEGLGSKGDALLVLRDDGPSSVVHEIAPLSVEAASGVEVVPSPSGPGHLVGSALTDSPVFTMGVTAIPTSVGSDNMAILSYTRGQTSNANRVTIASRSETGVVGVWDTGNTWLETSRPLVEGEKTRIHVSYNGAEGRAIYMDGEREMSESPIVAAPPIKTSLYIGAEDLSVAEAFTGKIGFVYVRHSVLPDAWIKAECDNLRNPSEFYSVSGGD